MYLEYDILFNEKSECSFVCYCISLNNNKEKIRFFISVLLILFLLYIKYFGFFDMIGIFLYINDFKFSIFI